MGNIGSARMGVKRVRSNRRCAGVSRLGRDAGRAAHDDARSKDFWRATKKPRKETLLMRVLKSSFVA
jgi:hypothetical protein